MPKLTIREVLDQNELPMEEAMDMDYKDHAAWQSNLLEQAGFACPDGYNCPRSFSSWLQEELVREEQVEGAYEQRAHQQLDALIEEERCG